MGTMRDLSRWVDRLEARARAAAPEPARTYLLCYDEGDGRVRMAGTDELLSREDFARRYPDAVTLRIRFDDQDDFGPEDEP